MLIAVTGDTHGRVDVVKRHLKLCKPDYLIHTGDFYSDGSRLARQLGLDFTGIRGNCDTNRKGELIEVVELDHHRFCVLHGHQHRVKHTLNDVYYYGLEMEAEVLVFGHTHVPCCEFQDGIWLLNPGSPSLPRLGYGASYILIKTGKGIIQPEIVALES